ncbi:SLC25A17 [Symbiodinium natans]|uniref:SLC25A17 protein n=1 Tax=Symbiodinium natans TaxID=878477 RepID=A0A812KRP9_9DINO|nr:SLC25A17 [Symbiodinium natans]
MVALSAVVGAAVKRVGESAPLSALDSESQARHTDITAFCSWAQEDGRYQEQKEVTKATDKGKVPAPARAQARDQVFACEMEKEGRDSVFGSGPGVAQITDSGAGPNLPEDVDMHSSSPSPPESQHRPESQPTPFCWDPPILRKVQATVPDSVPTPLLQESVAWPASQPVPPPPQAFLDSLPTPWFSQPTPKVELSDLRYISDPTPMPPKQEEDALPSPSIPTPLPAELCSAGEGAPSSRPAIQAAAADAVPSATADGAPRAPQDSPFATSLDVLSLPRQAAGTLTKQGTGAP